jgi:hypothetical protein
LRYRTSSDHPCRFLFSLLFKSDQEIIVRRCNHLRPKRIFEWSWTCRIHSRNIYWGRSILFFLLFLNFFFFWLNAKLNT